MPFKFLLQLKKELFCKLQAVTPHTESTSRHSKQHTQEILDLDPNLKK